MNKPPVSEIMKYVKHHKHLQVDKRYIQKAWDFSINQNNKKNPQKPAKRANPLILTLSNQSC